MYASTRLCLIKVNLEKVQERWWEAVLIDEPKISVRKIDPSRPITDLDDEAQAKIEELMYNEHQKRLGLPQSHEKVYVALCIFMSETIPAWCILPKACAVSCESPDCCGNSLTVWDHTVLPAPRQQ